MKKSVIFFLIGLLVLSLFGCSTAATTPPPAESNTGSSSTPAQGSGETTNTEPVTIEWIQWFDGSSAEGTVEKLIAEFEAEYPNIKVTPVNLPFGEVRNQVITNAAAGQLPDVIGMNPPWMAEFIDLGVLEPLDTYIQNDTSLSVSDLVQAPMAKYKDHTWMVPLTSSTFVLFYNKTMFAEAGLTNPPSNWQEMREYAKTLTNPDKDLYGFTLFMNEEPPANGSIVIMYPLIYAAGGRTVVDGKPSVEDPAVLQTLQFINDLHSDGSVIPGTTSKPEVQMVEEFSNGNIGMMIENTAHIGTLANRNPDLDYGLIPIPPVNSGDTPQLRSHGWELAMSSRSEHKQEAWTFINWLISKGPNAELAEASANIPGNKAADVSFYNDKPQLLDAIKIIGSYDLVEELMMMPKSTAHWQALTIETIKMLNGEQSPEQVIANTKQAWSELDQ